MHAASLTHSFTHSLAVFGMRVVVVLVVVECTGA